MTQKKLIVLAILLLGYILRAQTPPSPYYFNTAINGTETGKVNHLAPDGHWVAGSGSMPTLPAVHYSHTTCMYNNTALSGWIIPSTYTCSTTNKALHDCVGSQTVSFSLGFWLPTYTAGSAPVGTIMPSYAIDWLMFADDFISSIAINGSVVATPNAGSCLTGYRFRWCKNWKQGLNSIEVKVVSFTGMLGMQVVSNPPLSISIAGNTLVCPNSTNVYTASPAGVGGGTLYTWNRPLGWSAPTPNTSTVNTLATVSSPNSGLVQVSISSGSVCHAAAALSVNVSPTVTALTPTPICLGSNVVLTAGSANTYTWTKPPNTVISNAASVLVSPTSNTSYTVKGTSAPNCVSTKVVIVSVKPLPIVNVTPASTVICAGKSATLTGWGNASTYTWLPTTLGAGLTKVVSPTVNTTYALMGTAANACIKITTVGVTVLPSPTLAVSASPATICAGFTSQLKVLGAQSYNWLPPISSTSSLVNVTPGVTTNYSVTGTGTNGCKSTSATVVNVLTTPTVTVNPPVICLGFANTLTAIGATNYTWTIGAAPNTTVFAGTPSVVISMTTTTPYTVCGTAQTSTCMSCYNGTLVVGQTIPLVANDITLCVNSATCTTALVTSTLSVPVNYTWQPGGFTGPSPVLCQTSTVPAVYTISASSPSACPETATMAIKPIINCCSQSSVAGVSTLTSIGGNYVNTSYVMLNSQTLTSSAFFKNSEVLMAPDVEIVVPPGLQLDLIHTHFYACGNNMWKGIVVQDGGRITSPGKLGNSMIEDAHVAIDLDAISSASIVYGLPAINVEQVLFNRNFIGIKVSNSDPNVDSLALGIIGCIFTSRNFTFTTLNSPLIWPATSVYTFNCELKCINNSTTTSLMPPLNFAGFPAAVLKSPYASQPGHIGIKIENIGKPNGVLPMPGVQTNITYTNHPGEYNLFDAIGTGIEVTDASLTTIRNRFQNMRRYPYALSPTGWYGGDGINHTITDLRNARLALRAPTDDDGNHFWDCINGIKASNVYETWVRHSIFRSTQTVNSVTMMPQTAPGDVGLNLETNRFDFSVKECQFNNLNTGLSFRTPTASINFDMTGTGSTNGVYARGMVLEYNYFGPEVNSTTAYSSLSANTSEFMSDAIKIETPNQGMWVNSTTASYIVSNKINRSFRGIGIDGMNDHKLHVSQNEINIEDDFTTGSPALGYGISVMNNMDNLAVQFNTLQAQQFWYLNFPLPTTPTISLVYCNSNYGTQSPRIECNSTKDAYYGFNFESKNQSTVWEGNLMCTHYAGMALTNKGEIGQQGSASLGSGNVWDSNNCGVWGQNQALYYIFNENSDPLLSPLFVTTLAGNYPFPDNSAVGFPIYSPGNGLDLTPTVNNLNDCVGLGYFYNPPWWRLANPLANGTIPAEAEMTEAALLSIYPNPTTGKLYIAGLPENEVVMVNVLTVDGKLKHSEKVKGENECSINLSEYAPSIYIVEIRDNNNKVKRFKLIKTE